ncbi:MAG: Aspartate carbamoyltransferase regulatory chain [Candidatus Magasanikbacteria bacterium GW2011_GWA2_56_11]|uniref:Aspartate carbamoyltransferase regulatory chain n=1 Tax=Candidatus Magasanikbacteria bacterium GW2011_GWA2_56_11 TaxID=1619044 RepID=A0A0G2BBH2_9BACT|nr:MAG: Aspartate carbamoyltransferase regulatory chain [Candidatus Magasanikbacteria bacterium GW2011_GWA2_56_11]
MRAYKVFAIKDGTVIDHIPNGKGLRLIAALKLNDMNTVLTMGTHFTSKRLGRKDIVKIEHKELSPSEVNQVCLFAPTATINIIREHKVVKKFTVAVPPVFTELVICPNSRCITNHERTPSTFYPLADGERLRLRCHYCEKIFSHEEVSLR